MKTVKPLAIGGYKAGMTHIVIVDKRANSASKGEQITIPATIVECPPMVIWGVRFYKNTPDGKRAVSQLTMDSPKKELGRKIILPKKQKTTWDNLPVYDDLVLLVHSQPKETGIGKKKPEVFEIALGGSKDEKLTFAKDKLGREVDVKDVFKNGQLVDVHGITTGKGYAGVVKKHGVAIRSHKSEKSIRAAVMAPEGIAKVQPTAPMPGRIGYHLRTLYNLQVLLIGDNPAQINQMGGIPHYGQVKKSFVLIKGSLPGPTKRFVLFTEPIRVNTKIDQKPLEIVYISTSSKQ